MIPLLLVGSLLFFLGLRMERRKAAVITLLLIILVLLFLELHTVRMLPQSKQLPLIPASLWQIFIGDYLSNDFSFQPLVNSWLALNPNTAYTRLDITGARTLVSASPFAESLHPIFDHLNRTVCLADLTRYVLLYEKGGAYSDMDTTAIIPMKEWIPAQYQGKTKLVVGVEYDGIAGEKWPGPVLPVQFCQWTIMAAPGHPILKNAVERAVASILDLAKGRNKRLDELIMYDADVAAFTGPVMWSQIVFEYLSKVEGKTIGPDDLADLREPRLFDDVLVLPIDAFGGFQPHLQEVLKDTGRELVRHHFRGSWKTGW